MKYYSSTEKFNIAARRGILEVRKKHKDGETTGEVVYDYKGNTLKVKYDAFLKGDGSLDYVGIFSIEKL